MADNVNIIVQETINDIVVNAAVIVETIDINVQAAVDVVDIVANPNNYVVNINRIIGEQVQSDWDQADDQAPDYIKNKPTIPTATSDLTNDGEDGINPFITAADVPASLLVALPFTTDHLTVTNNAYVVGDVVWYLGNVYRCIANNDSILPTSTAYWTNLGSGNPLVAQPSDWNSTSGNNQILNKPTIPVVTGFVPYTGATQDVDLGEFEIKAGQVEFDQTPTGTAGVGVMRWNDSDGTVDLGLKGGNVTLQIGQEQVLRVVNKTATNVNLLEANYQAVRVTGAQGQRLKVDLAQATTDTLSAETIGLVTETINNNQEGFITTSGLVRGINTTGSLQGETWADGDILYLSPTTAGRATKVKPTAPNHLIILGYVIHAHINQGSIFVKVDNGYELDELHNVKITTPANNNVLAYTSATDIWENKTINTVIGYTPVTDARTISTTAPLSGGGDLTANRTLSISQATTSTDGFLTSTNWNTFNNKFTLPALTSGSVLFSNGTTIAQDNAQLFWDDTNNRLGIGTNAPNRTFVVYDGSAPHIQLATSTSGLTSTSGFQLRIVSNNVLFTNFQASNMTFGNSGATHITLFNSGNLLVSSTTTTDAGFKLDVNGTARIVNKLSVGTPSAASALMEVTSTTLGFLPPRMTTTQKNAIATPAAGLVVYDTTLNKLCVRTAAAWETITSI